MAAEFWELKSAHIFKLLRPRNNILQGVKYSAVASWENKALESSHFKTATNCY